MGEQFSEARGERLPGIISRGRTKWPFLSGSSKSGILDEKGRDDERDCHPPAERLLSEKERKECRGEKASVLRIAER